jgi:hypothetical protein
MVFSEECLCLLPVGTLASVHVYGNALVAHVLSECTRLVAAYRHEEQEPLGEVKTLMREEAKGI